LLGCICQECGVSPKNVNMWEQIEGITACFKSQQNHSLNSVFNLAISDYYHAGFWDFVVTCTILNLQLSGTNEYIHILKGSY